jgi:cell division protein FtsX
LVITQFAIAQLLIISTIVIASQMRYAGQADLGFRKDAIVMLPLPDRDGSKLSTIRSQLAQIPGVEQLTLCSDAPASQRTPSTGIRFDTRPEGEKFSILFKAGDPEFIATFGLKLLAGRNLYPSDTIREFLINETTVRKLGLSSNQEVLNKKAVIHQAIDAAYISTSVEHYSNCAVKINTASLRPVLASLEKTWKSVYPAHIYKLSFVDQQIAQFYKLDNMILHLVQLFTAISIVIGCIGLYGLIAFMAARRTKEIGIRKTLGADVTSIIWLFSKEFVMMALLAFVFAAPLAWWAMAKWLNTFVYRVSLGAGVFALAMLISLFIVVVTVGYQAMRAALMNPVKALRSE